MPVGGKGNTGGINNVHAEGVNDVHAEGVNIRKVGKVFD